MAKPIVLIRVDSRSKNFVRDVSIMKAISNAIKDEYTVLGVPKELDITVLNGEIFEISDEKMKEFQDKIEEQLRNIQVNNVGEIFIDEKEEE